MLQSYFEHYVLGGGWAMLILVPASVVVVAVLVRGLLSLREKEFTSPSAFNRANAVVARLRQIIERHKNLTAEDVRAETSREILDVYAGFQPLVLITFVAPLIGLLASVLRLMAAQRTVASTGSIEPLAAATEQALIPMAWGVGVACLAYAAFVLLRSRLYYVERELLVPAAERAAGELTSTPILKRAAKSDAESA